MVSVTGIWTDSGGTQFREIGGVLRNVTGTWEILTDATHKPLNLTSVTADKTHIYLNLPAGTWIGPLLVTPDETYASYGIFVGASVLQNQARIYMYHMIAGKMVLINPLTLKTTLGNLWIMGRQFV